MYPTTDTIDFNLKYYHFILRKVFPNKYQSYLDQWQNPHHHPHPHPHLHHHRPHWEYIYKNNINSTSNIIWQIQCTELWLVNCNYKWNKNISEKENSKKNFPNQNIKAKVNANILSLQYKKTKHFFWQRSREFLS